ncbi:MAG: hypothetical protein JW795_13215, partial [Chitinivibrionales bacterium]|nr:hypothetical protein [Chitinivibrionales bacterium]
LRQLTSHESTASFLVASISAPGYPSAQDSIWIDTGGTVADVLGNYQEVQNNKRVRLELRIPPFRMQIRAIGPADPRQEYLPKFLTDDCAKQFAFPLQQGITIIVEPDVVLPEAVARSIDCNCTIFDPLGNCVGSGGSLNERDNRHVQMYRSTRLKSGSCVILWSAQNDNGRFIGSGTYSALVTVTYDGVKICQERVFVGVRENTLKQ